MRVGLRVGVLSQGLLVAGEEALGKSLCGNRQASLRPVRHLPQGNPLVQQAVVGIGDL
jgi:hypothetical protein